MKEWKIEREARERVGDTKRDTKPQRKPRDKGEGLLSVDKSTCPYCQQDHFAGRCNTVTNVNTRKNGTMSFKLLPVQREQREGINQDIVKEREHAYDRKDDIIQASAKDIKTVQNNKLIMIKVAIQRRVTKVKIAKEIIIKHNNQMHQELQLTP